MGTCMPQIDKFTSLFYYPKKLPAPNKPTPTTLSTSYLGKYLSDTVLRALKGSHRASSPCTICDLGNVISYDHRHYR
jgi:hypothetical protein